MTSHPKTVVMGAGNILMRDDGIGVYAIRALKQRSDIPEYVQIVDAGTAGADCLFHCGDVERLIIIDAVRGGGKPGTLYRLSPEDIREAPQKKLSLHQMTLMESLEANQLLGAVPREIIIIGVEPADIAEGMGLSVELTNQVPRLVETVLQLIDH